LAQSARYHEWWYRDRDHDADGLAEYGSTDDLNAYLYLEKTLLADFAEWLGKEDEAARWIRLDPLVDGRCDG
jgi:hypothetical protein